jgi:hypothetical protein
MKFVDKIHTQNYMNCRVLLFSPTCEEIVSGQGVLIFFLQPMLFITIRITPFFYIIRQLETLETPTPLTLTQINFENQVQPVDEFLFNTPKKHSACS